MPLAPARPRWPAAELGRLPSLSSMRDEMSRLIDGLFLRTVPSPVALFEAGDGSAWIPAIDLSETDAEIRVRAELPGVAPEDVDVSVSGERLVISGEKKSSAESKGDGWAHRESSYGSFSRTIALPESVDPAKVTAAYDKGVLTVTMCKEPSSKTRKIPVKTS